MLGKRNGFPSEIQICGDPNTPVNISFGKNGQGNSPSGENDARNNLGVEPKLPYIQGELNKKIKEKADQVVEN